MTFIGFSLEIAFIMTLYMDHMPYMLVVVLFRTSSDMRLLTFIPISERTGYPLLLISFFNLFNSLISSFTYPIMNQKCMHMFFLKILLKISVYLRCIGIFFSVIIFHLRVYLKVLHYQVLRNKPDFRRKPWPSISNSAKDFVKKLLVKDPRARLTAAQALCMCIIYIQQ